MHYPDFFRQPAAPFTQQVLSDAGEWFAKDPHVERCGLVVEGRFLPCENVATDPAQRFEIRAEGVAAYSERGVLEGVIHSHPNGPWWPSQADMAGQIALGVPWAIMVPGETSSELACHWGGQRPAVFSGGDHLPRAFLHGVSDCYALVRDYYQEVHRIQLAEFPRKWEWWKEPDSDRGMYLDNLIDQGFEVIATDPAEIAALARPGDGYLMAIRSTVPNHAGIVLDQGLVLDHCFGRLSERQPLHRKVRHMTHLVRRRELLEQS